ncbi:MAG: tetratricopeptide repeat protein [Lewinellaceae bacterium]|nr:tetratricopeptide repeat protein [Saprospiraceae bacterium]MCB9339664.1 tetratricopeptide repeat protein [Lewinellaceae bacterium]
MKAQLVQDLETALSNQNFQQALAAGNSLLAQFPNDMDSYILNGDVYSGMGNWGKAVEYYERAESFNPGEAIVYFKLGDTYERKGDAQTAYHHYYSALTLSPENYFYRGNLGRLLYEKGRESNNFDLKKQGLEQMEMAANAGAADRLLKEQLALAYLDQCAAVWRQHPENKDEYLATEREHLDFAKDQITKARHLTDGSNQVLNNYASSIEGHVSDGEKRKFRGYPYLLKAPAIVGALLLVFGQTAFGIVLLLMAGMYYFSQLKPGYLVNRMFYKNDYRDPFIVRRLDALGREMGNITIWATSLSDLFMMQFLFKLVFGFIRYGMVIVMLPYEIFKGFWVNYDLQHKMVAKTAA